MNGTDIRAVRKAMGLTQEEFANLLHVSYSTVNRWEADRNKPHKVHLEKLLDFRAKNIYVSAP